MTHSTCTVLIVENFLPDRELYRRCLSTDKSCTYRLLEVETAIEGLELCRTETIDAIVLDYLLPDGDGLAFLQALHAQSHGTRPPVVVVTGQGDESIAVQAIKLGAEDYLVKRRLTPDLLRLTVRSAIENARLRLQLQQSHDQFRVSIENMLDCFGICSAIRNAAGQIVDFRIDYLNAAALTSNQMTVDDIGKGLCELYPAHLETGLFDEYCRVVETGNPLVREELIFSDTFGVQFLTRAFDIHASKFNDGLVLSWRDVTARKQAELERQQQLERERILNRLTQQIRRSLDLSEVLNTAVVEVRQFLSADRAFIYRFNPDFSGVIVVESVSEGLPSAIDAAVEDTYFLETQGEDYRQGRIQVVEDIYTAGLTECHVEMLARFQIRANLVVPILQGQLQGEFLWGLLVLSQCACPRQWQPAEIDLLQQLAAQLGIALKQAELYEQARTELAERQRAEAALQQSHDRFEQAAAAVSCLIYDWDLQRDVIQRAGRLYEVTGYLPEETDPSSQWWFDLMHPDDRPQKSWERVMTELAPLDRYCNEYRVRHKEGHYIWVEDWATVIKNDAGVPVRIVGSTRDISKRKATEARLQESQARLALSLECSQQGMWDYDLVADQAYWSPQCKRLFGVNADDSTMTKQQFLNCLHPDDRDRVTAAVAAVLETYCDYDIEYRVVLADGTARWLHARAKVLRDAQNQPTRLIGTVMDISDRKQDEQRLRESEERLQIGVQVAGVALAHFDYSTNQVTLSPEAAALFGIPADQPIITRDRIHATFHPEERDELFAMIRQVLDPDGDGWFAREHRVVWQTGEVRWLSVRKQVFFNRSGSTSRPDYAILAAIDITARKQSEAALQQSEERYRYLAGLIPQLVWIADASGTILDLNERWSEYTGLTLAQAQVMGWAAVVYPEDVPILTEAWATAQRSGIPYQAEARMRRADGVYRWHLHQAMPLTDSQGCIIKWFGTATDIHDLKQIEVERTRLLAEAQAARAEAEAANRNKDEFVTLVAHELRSPLNAILGWARLLQTRQLDGDTTARALETIARNTQAQVQLVEDLLDVSRMVRGTLQLTFDAVNLVDVIEAAIETINPTAETKPLSLSTRLQPTAPVWGDFNRLQQIILNLLTNAIKFTPAGGRVEVTLECVGGDGEMGRWGDGEMGRWGDREVGNGGVEEPGSEGGKQSFSAPLLPNPLTPQPPSLPASQPPCAQITVTDTGKGISPEFLPQVFQRFRQDQQTATAKEGLGLGLAIVKHLVELHDGTITVSSGGAGQGATFTILLPLLGGEEQGSRGAGEQGGWKDGEMEGWKDGEMEGWKDGEIEAREANLSTPHRLTASSPHPLTASSPHPLTASSPHPPALAGLRILLVDDEPDMLELATFALEDYGAIVETADSVAAALEKLSQFQPQLLLSDIAMPHQDGYDLLRQMRSIHPEGQIPAIALTAYASESRREEAFAAGFQEYLTKPIEPEQLVNVISGLLGQGEIGQTQPEEG